MDALSALLQLNELVNNERNKQTLNLCARSTIRGNRELNDRYEPGSEVHGVLISLVSTLGKLQNERNFPEDIKDNIVQLEHKNKEYAEVLLPVCTAFKEKFPTEYKYEDLNELTYAFYGLKPEHWSDIPQMILYGDISDEIIVSRIQDTFIRETVEKARAISKESQLIQNKMDIYFASCSEITVENNVIPNQYLTDIQWTDKKYCELNLSNWLFCGKRAAGTFLDTTLIAESLSSYYRRTLGEAGGIVRDFGKAVIEMPEWQISPILQPFEKSFEKAQDMVVAYNGYNTIREKGYADALWLESEEDYKVILQRVQENKPYLFTEKRQTVKQGKCPFHP